MNFFTTILFLLLSVSNLTAAEKPHRIVSLVPSQTEMIFAVNMGKALVGRTSYCNYPPQASEAKDIGSMDLAIETIVSLRPTIIVDLNSMNQKYENIFAKLNLRYVNFNISHIDQIPQLAIDLSRELDCEDAGQAFAADWQQRFEIMSMATPQNEVKVYLEIWSPPSQSVGQNSLIGQMITAAKGSNIIKAETDFPIVNGEAVIQARPEVIFIAYPIKDLNSIKNRPGWQSLPAVANNNIYAVDQDLFVRPGPRNLQGIEELNRIINSLHTYHE